MLTRLEAAFAPQLYRPADVWAVAGACVALLVFFYSGNFFNWPGLKDMYYTFGFWGHTAHDAKNGHTKEFIYWTQLLLLNEPVAVAGLCACLRYVVPPLSTPRYRWLGVGGRRATSRRVARPRATSRSSAWSEPPSGSNGAWAF